MTTLSVKIRVTDAQAEQLKALLTIANEPDLWRDWKDYGRTIAVRGFEEYLADKVERYLTNIPERREPAMSEKHTAGQLRLERDGIKTATGEKLLIDGVALPCGNNDGGRENAARLVLCWNSHDALVAALETADDALCAAGWSIGKRDPKMQKDLTYASNRVRLALAATHDGRGT